MSTNLTLCLAVCMATSPAEKTDLGAAHKKFVQGVEHFATILSDLPKPLAKNWKKPAEGFEQSKHLAVALSRYQKRGIEEFDKVHETFYRFRQIIRKNYDDCLELVAQAKAAKKKGEADSYQSLAELYWKAMENYEEGWKKMTRQLKIFQLSRSQLERRIKSAPAFISLAETIRLIGDKDLETKMTAIAIRQATDLNTTLSHFREFAADVRAVSDELQPLKSKKKPTEKE